MRWLGWRSTQYVLATPLLHNACFVQERVLQTEVEFVVLVVVDLPSPHFVAEFVPRESLPAFQPIVHLFSFAIIHCPDHLLPVPLLHSVCCSVSRHTGHAVSLYRHLGIPVRFAHHLCLPAEPRLCVHLPPLPGQVVSEHNSAHSCSVVGRCLHHQLIFYFSLFHFPPRLLPLCLLRCLLFLPDWLFDYLARPVKIFKSYTEIQCNKNTGRCHNRVATHNALLVYL